jgi:hypothetical protein
MKFIRQIASLVVLIGLALTTTGLPSSQAAPTAPSLYLPIVSNLGYPSLFGCPAFPPDNIWNRRIDSLPADQTLTATYLNNMGGPTRKLHADFGDPAGIYGGPFGIPYTSVSAGQALANISFYYNEQSDPGPYPIPPNVPIEGGSDHHVLVVDRSTCKLYEMWDSTKVSDSAWTAGSGAVFDLRSNALRPDTWTSADAAGLPILPGLLRYDEIVSGSIQHAIRFTTHATQRAYVWPARHQAGSQDSTSYPPMGARFRLKASVDISGYDPSIQVVFKAFKEYGLILADNGSDWYISGAPDPHWNDDLLVSAFSSLHAQDFEYVDVSSLMISPDSGQSK